MPVRTRRLIVAPMRCRGPLILLSLLAAPASGQPAAPGLPAAEAPPPESVYAPPRVDESADGGFNEGALALDITGRYVTDYVFRGLEIVEPDAREDAINVQVDALLTLDLGRLPDPFVRVFTNTAEGDNISNFQTIRPSVGLSFEGDAFDLDLGYQSFTYPDRDGLDTSEVFALLTIDDGYLAGGEEPILGPYVFAAYDYDAFTGTYIEAGLLRAFDVGESNFDVRLNAHVAYVDSFEGLYGGDGSGFSHYQLSATLHYDLNTLLNISRRYGHFGVEGYINFTDGIDDEFTTTNQIWGGAGITFRY